MRIAVRAQAVNAEGQRVEGIWEETETMRVVGVTVLLALCLIASGCSGDSGAGSEATGDCSAQVRVDGIVYTSYGYTERKASKHSVANRADCEDVGENAAGSVFPEHPEQVTTWSFRGYPPEEVLGVRVDKTFFAVFVADSVQDAERERIFQELDQPSP